MKTRIEADHRSQTCTPGPRLLPVSSNFCSASEAADWTRDKGGPAPNPLATGTQSTAGRPRAGARTIDWPNQIKCRRTPTVSHSLLDPRLGGNWIVGITRTPAEA